MKSSLIRSVFVRSVVPVPQPIHTGTFQTYDYWQTRLGQSGSVAVLSPGVFQNVEQALQAVGLTPGTKSIGYGYGTREWCYRWPVKLVENREGRFAIVLDLQRSRLASYKYADTIPRQRIVVTETVHASRRRTFWR